MSLCVITSPTSPAAAYPVHATLSPASLKPAPDLLTRLQSDECVLWYLRPASDTNVAISVPAGRRITQDEEIHTQAEGGREPGSSRTEAQHRYRCTKKPAPRSVYRAYVSVCDYVTYQPYCCLTPPAAAYPVHATLSPASLKSAPDLLTRLQSDECELEYLRPASDTNVAISVPAGRRITQDEEIHTQAEGGREPGFSRTEAQRRYRCTKKPAPRSVYRAYVSVCDYVTYQPCCCLPRARYTLPCQPQARPGLANQATVRRVRAGVSASRF
ncbi:UNVERIFIED_CONTAM: hypothetical protein FKN15_038779 [Acipenser sinensis]